MCAFATVRRICVLLVVSLCISAIPQLLLADEKKNTDGSTEQPANSAFVSSTPGSSAKAAPSAPAPGLTERERMLLDRVEQLEKRVAEL
jgi:hypothetical protein